MPGALARVHDIAMLRKIGESHIAKSVCLRRLPPGVSLREITGRDARQAFDRALDKLHYAKSCQRVGRCMRLAVFFHRQWAGGIVLGSTFPNIEVRDEAVGLKKYVRGWKQRGLRHPWARENRNYWNGLQKVVNHARTFVFPEFQGKGIGIEAHRRLLTAGVRLWEKKYGDVIAALDTLCDHSESKLFAVNGWTCVGETKGYCSDKKSAFSQRGCRDGSIRNNVALKMTRKAHKWVVWVIVLRRSAI